MAVAIRPGPAWSPDPPPPASSTLSGLMSRCTTPFWCAYASALAISRKSRRLSLTGSSPWRASRARSDSPVDERHREERHALHLAGESSGTMCGCWSRAARAISRLKRSIETPAASSGGRTFTTTVRPSAVSFAVKTRDIPPPPSSRSRVYASKRPVEGDRGGWSPE